MFVSVYDTVINRAEALYRALSLLAHCATMSSDGATLYKAVKEGNAAKVQRLMSSDGKKLYDAAKDGHNAKVRMWLSKGVPWDAWRTEVMCCKLLTLSSSLSPPVCASHL